MVHVTHYSFTDYVFLFGRNIAGNLDVVCYSLRQRSCSQIRHHTGLTELNHPAYSPDIVHSDYHLLSNLKSFLRGMNLETDDDRKSQCEES